FGQRPKTMILQEFIQWDDYIRCICIGRRHINPIRYDPMAPFHERYVIDRPVEGAVRERAIHDAIALTDALGYDMDTVEFAVRDGILYAIDFLNPAPDADVASVGAENFEWVLSHASQWLIERVPSGAEPVARYHWQDFLASHREPARAALPARPRPGGASGPRRAAAPTGPRTAAPRPSGASGSPPAGAGDASPRGPRRQPSASPDPKGEA
ncbi:MAG: glutathione synthase, partial [Thermoanaerobaculia bacterium]